MSKITLIKTPAGWANADNQAYEFHKKLKLGAAIHADFKLMRNIKFHRKFFALLNLAFDYWEPGEINTKYGIPKKSFDRFRKDVIILAGYYHPEIRLDGSVRIVADSIKFANMDEEIFNRLYQNVLTVILNKIPKLSKLNNKEVDDIVEKILSFA